MNSGVQAHTSLFYFSVVYDTKSVSEEVISSLIPDQNVKYLLHVGTFRLTFGTFFLSTIKIQTFVLSRVYLYRKNKALS